MRSPMMVRSSLFSFAINTTKFWLTNRDNTGDMSARVKNSQGVLASGEDAYATGI